MTSMNSVRVGNSEYGGEGLFLARKVSPGAVAVRESPALSWVVLEYAKSVCGYCFKMMEPESCNTGSLPCNSCRSCDRVVYCSDICRSLDEFNHRKLCELLSLAAAANFNSDEDSFYQLCVRVLKFYESKDPTFFELWRMDCSSAGIDETERHVVAHVHAFMRQAGITGVPTLEWAYELYKKDKCNGFAVMLPYELREDGFETSSEGEETMEERHVDDSDPLEEDQDLSKSCTRGIVRGFGLFPVMGKANHSCIPNCIRWDLVDECTRFSPQERRDMMFRTLYELPAGTELLQSYVPIGWGYEERQKYLSETYGFSCTCARCKIEGSRCENFKLHGNESMTVESAGEIDPCSEEDEEKEEENAVDATYLELFLLRHVCFQERCTGTLTPVLGFDSNSARKKLRMYECNVCAAFRSHDEFIRIIAEEARV